MVLLMWALFRLEKEEKEPSDSFENGKGIALIKDFVTRPISTNLI
jgi:hypothetical protein